MNDLRLTEFNPATGEVKYRGESDLGGGRTLTFYVEGNVGGSNQDPTAWVKLKLDAYEAADFETALRRMPVWLRSVLRVLEGDMEWSGPPRRIRARPEPEPADEP